ncbi:MAG: HD domain-containing protein [Phycisphaerales bacterium]|nr:MAG: HD domain-containing protein [Phycisphaerales bacterium]
MNRGESHNPPEKDRRKEPRTDPQRTAHHDLIFAFARASEQHDADVGDHLHHIRAIVELIALQMGFVENDAEDLGYDAMLHDVGKLHVPADVLNKRDELTEEERQLIQSHTTHGEVMLQQRPGTSRAARIARSHHESWDGTGYPDGLEGEAIPLEARITAAADMLDALLADRSYKDAWSYDRAIQAVLAERGRQLDPGVADALRACHEAGSLRRVYDM